MKYVHNISVKLLDLVFILHKEIYSKLLFVAAGETSKSVNYRHKLAVLSSDFMLMASAVIAAASFIIDEQVSDKVSVIVGCTTKAGIRKNMHSIDVR